MSLFSTVARRGMATAITGVSGARVVNPEALRSGDDGQAPLQQAIFYSNHSSHLDMVTLWAALPAHLQKRVRPIAAKDYWGSGVKKALAEKLFNAYLVDRHGASTSKGRDSGSGVSPKGQITGMTEVLDGGDSLIIFPEGTRGSGEMIAQFHGGLYKLAQHDPRIPVVPVALSNLGRILPKGERVPVPHLSKVTFHPPLYVGADEPKAEFLDRARQVLVETLREDGSGDEEPGDTA